MGARRLSLLILCLLGLHFPSQGYAIASDIGDGGSIERLGGRTYYEILQIAEDSSEQNIKGSFRRLAMQFHPDHNPGNAAAEAEFKAISEAYAVLKDAVQRAAYDRKLVPKNPVHHPRTSATPHPHHRERTYRPTPEEVSAHELDEMFMAKARELLARSVDAKPNSALVEELGRQIQRHYGQYKTVQFKSLLLNHLLEDPVGSFLLRGGIRYWQLNQNSTLDKNIDLLRSHLQTSFYNLEKWAHSSGVIYSREQLELTAQKERYIERLLSELQEMEAIAKPQENIISRSLEACRAYLKILK